MSNYRRSERRSVTRLAAIILVLALAVASRGAAAPPPPQAAPTRATVLTNRITAAYLRGDEDALARLGAAASATVLETMLNSSESSRVLAALEAAPAAPDSWALLARLADLAEARDRMIAAPAARRAAIIAARLDRELLLLHDVPDDDTRYLLSRWRELGARPDRWADVRVHALEVSLAIADALGGDALPEDVAFDVEARLADADPEVRRTAAELLPTPLTPAQREAVAALVRDDPQPEVALAAAQALCSGLAAGDPAKPAIRALGAAGLARIRAVIAKPTAAPVAAVDAARCLLADASPPSLLAVERLQARLPPYLAAALTEEGR